ncbi:hypothetical protein BDV28DRAFT_22528 [Aspergillus coremiiformis]|uniref:Methyltransferase domain-containing protein n=1 Tax=Aspergillus coremiiformis TaxID=138285 RepID=A0A5N6Z0W7_9EURO|nr:hypothetical protein BDV28DRAFT_22528 [Aspergillus coremiiformis]
METILSSCLHDPNSDLKTRFYIPRFVHRLSIANAWGITPGQRILDIGCGQGESCLVLALLVGTSGHITGIDTAQPEYGSPFTVQQSHEYAKQSTLGSSLTFLRTDTRSFLHRIGHPASDLFDAAVLCHSLWYFPDRQSVADLFHTLSAAGVPRVYLCEYSYEASVESQNVHILAAQAQALFYRYRTPRAPGDLEQNVRVGLDQASILEVARGAGFGVKTDGVITPAPTMLEGHFEVEYVAGKKFTRVVLDEGLPERQEAEVLAYVTRVRRAMEKLKETGASTGRTMNVWWAVLELEQV